MRPILYFLTLLLLLGIPGMADLRDKTVNYRRCVATPAQAAVPAGTFNLQDALQEACKIVPSPRARPISADGKMHQSLLTIEKKHGCLCGKIVITEEGKSVPLCGFKADGTAWEGSMAPDKKGGFPKHVEDHRLFFAIKENHVAVLPSDAISISDLRDFLSWLIQETSKTSTEWIFDLENLASQSARQKLKDHRISGIRFTKRASETIRVPLTPAEKASGKYSARTKYRKDVKVDSFAASILKRFSRDNQLVDRISSSGNMRDLSVEVNIQYHSRSGKDSQEIMQAIASSLGGSTDVDPEIVLNGTSSIKGDELTIRGKVRVPFEKGLPKSPETIDALGDWLTKSIDNGTVLL